LEWPRERIFTGYDVVDNEYFRQKAEEIKKSEVGGQTETRASGELLLCLSAFIEKKNLRV